MRRWKKWRKPVIKHAVPTRWGWVVWYPEKFQLNKNVDIGWGTFIQAQEGVSIEEGAQIAGGCFLYSVSTIDGRRGPILIKREAAIGANSVVMPRVVIKEKSIIGALSFVPYGTIIPPNEIWAGAPIRRIGGARQGQKTHIN